MSELHIPVIKGGKGATVPVDTETVPGEYYAAALALGFKTIVNGGSQKIIKPSNPEDEAAMASFHAAANSKAAERVEAMMTGKLRLNRAAASATTTPHAVMVEARRLAKQLIKDKMREAGLKLTHYAASAITKAANDLLADPEQGTAFIRMAEDNLAARKTVNIPVNLAGMAVDDKLVKAAEERKQVAGGILSAAKAGQPRARTTRH